MEPDEQQKKIKREIVQAAERLVREKGVVSAKEVYIEMTGKPIYGRQQKASGPVSLNEISMTLRHNGFYVLKYSGNGRTLYAHRIIKKEGKDE